MTKDDKQFIKSLVKGLGEKIIGVETRLEAKIQYNGVMLEKLQGTVGSIGDNVMDLNCQMNEVRTDVADIKETIHDYPIVRKMVQRHERQLAKSR